MALKPVQDPALLAALNGPDAPAAGPKPVTDPALLAELNKPELAPGQTELNSQIPEPAGPAAPLPEEPSIWEKFKAGLSNAVGGDAPDPVLDMLGHGLSTVVQGAPEVIAGGINNAVAQSVAGLAGSFVPDANDSANFMRDFIQTHSHEPQGENAKALSAGLDEAMEPLANIKRSLGEGTLEATGSPGLAAAADTAPDLAMMLLGGPKAAEGAAELPKTPLKADTVVNPKVGDLRAADIRLRPSDVRAMTPGAKKVPGEFREKFADAPELKKNVTLHNQQRFTDIASKEIGTKDLTDASLEAAEKPHTDKYQQAEDALLEHKVSDDFANTFREAAASAKLPKGEQSGITRVIGALRRRATTRARSNDVKTEEAGYADRDLADKLEESFGKELAAAGEPQLLKEYQDARQALAKINDVRMTTRADHIDAAKLYQLNQKSEGKRLTGGLKLIADASEYAENVTKHSRTTAARAGGEIEGSREGITKGFLKGAIRKIPGMNVGSKGFQDTLGKADEARTSYYGQKPDIAPERGPEQHGLDLREALQLDAPPGEVGAPVRSQRDLGPQTDALGSAFEFNRPPGEVGIPPDAQISLQDLLGLGEPLDLKKSPGRVGKPKRAS